MPTKKYLFPAPNPGLLEIEWSGGGWFNVQGNVTITYNGAMIGAYPNRAGLEHVQELLAPDGSRLYVELISNSFKVFRRLSLDDPKVSEPEIDDQAKYDLLFQASRISALLIMSVFLVGFFIPCGGGGCYGPLFTVLLAQWLLIVPATITVSLVYILNSWYHKRGLGNPIIYLGTPLSLNILGAIFSLIFFPSLFGIFFLIASLM